MSKDTDFDDNLLDLEGLADDEPNEGDALDELDFAEEGLDEELNEAIDDIDEEKAPLTETPVEANNKSKIILGVAAAVLAGVFGMSAKNMFFSGSEPEPALDFSVLQNQQAPAPGIQPPAPQASPQVLLSETALPAEVTDPEPSEGQAMAEGGLPERGGEAPVTALIPEAPPAVEVQNDPALEAVSQQVDDLTSHVEDIRTFQERQLQILQDLRQTVSRLHAQVAQVSEAAPVQPEVLTAQVYDDVEGRSRLGGFNVVNWTQDGTMSIVKTPKGSIITLFAGERFRDASGRVQTVSAIDEQGRRILVGKEGYIDAKRAPVTQVRQSAPAIQPAERGPQKAAGWKVIGFNTVTAVVQDGKGDIHSVKIGDTLPGIGRVSRFGEQGQVFAGSRYVEVVGK